MLRSEMVTLTRAIAQVEIHSVDDPTLDAYLNEGYAEIVSNRTWPWCYALAPESVPLVADITEYALDAKVKRVIAVVNVEDRYELESVAQSEWARRQHQIESTSRPRIFTFTNQTLFIWPIPAVVETLEVYFYEHPVWDSETAPVFDTAFHTAIVDWALHRIWEQEEDFEKSDDYRTRFEMRLNRMGLFYNNAMQDPPKIYGQSGRGLGPSNMPWLGDAVLGGATG